MEGVVVGVIVTGIGYALWYLGTLDSLIVLLVLNVLSLSPPLSILFQFLLIPVVQVLYSPEGLTCDFSLYLHTYRSDKK